MSYANAARLEFTTESHRLYVYNKKSNGPRMEPCGNPELTGIVVKMLHLLRSKPFQVTTSSGTKISKAK